MRKLFLKYFFSILAITVFALFIQNGLLLLKYSQSQNKWKDFVYFDFVDSIEQNLTNNNFADFSIDSMKIFNDAMSSDSRVSGFIVRDKNGKVSFTVGKSAEGKLLASAIPGSIKSTEAKQIPDVYHTTLNIVFNGKSFDIERTTSVYENYNFVVVAGVNANDIIGSVSIAFEGESVTTIDILSYSPRTYIYSREIIESCIKSIIIAIPICLLITLVCSYFISSRNAKYINSIRKALNDLAHGKSDVKLEENKNSELNEITVAVSELDSTLQSNKKSRQAWLTSISHDLNTPATSMKMIIDGLNDGIFKPTKSTLKDLQNENDILCERIGRVIEYSSLQSDTKAVLETVKCSDLISNLPAEYSSLQTCFEVSEIRCDKKLMSKAIVELVKNAFAASQNTEVKLSIKQDNSQYVLSVTNTGHLPKDFSQNQFFEPWSKGDSSRESSGNGLGLAIVGSIVKLHNGEVSISEKDGLVTVFVKWAL